MVFKYKYDFSIVMGYYNRKSQTINTLNYFQQQYIDYNYEVVIVDDDSKPEHKLTDIIPNYNFPLKYIEITKTEKGSRINPSTTYNKGFNQAEGEYVIIQNPECIHVGDILGFVGNTLKADEYITFSCYNCSSHQLTQELMNDLSKIKNNDFNLRNSVPWYNHPTLRPVSYHFCSAITNDNLKILGGFNDEFSKGHSYDDNELILSIRYNLLLNIKIIPPESVYVIHQWHDKDVETQYLNETIGIMRNRNKNLYHRYLKHHEKYKFNFPKLLHLYWDGSPLSPINLLTIFSFNKYNIAWKINVYVPLDHNNNLSCNTDNKKKPYNGVDYFKQLEKISNVNIHYIDRDFLPSKYKESPEVIRRDYFRLYILNKFGGLWSDFDIIYTGSLEEYYNNLSINKNLVIYRYPGSKPSEFIFPLGLLLSNKNNSILSTILNYIDVFYDKKNYQSIGSCTFEHIFGDKYTEEQEVIQQIRGHINMDELYIDNAECYLKIKYNQLYLLYSDNNILPEIFINNKQTLGIQWFNGSTITKSFYDTLDLNKLKYKESTNLIEKFIKLYI